MAELDQLRRVDGELSQELGRATHEAYLSRLELLQVKRSLAQVLAECQAEEGL